MTSAVNKINKLVSQIFTDQESIDKWNAADFQKKIKKVFRNKKEKLETETKDKAPYSSYIKFCMDERPQIKKKFPTLSAKDITAKLGEEWKRLKQEDPEYLEQKYDYKDKEKQVSN